MSLLTDDLTTELTVSRVNQETNDTSSISFSIPSDSINKFEYIPGQFITLSIEIDGEQVNRSYSLSSTPKLDSDFTITVKRVAGGKMSNYLLDNIKIGSLIRSTPPAGLFYKDKHIDKSKPVLLFAGGSGITPIISIAKHLVINFGTRVCLVYSSRNQENIIFEKKIHQLSVEQSNFTYQHILSQPADSWAGAKGRITKNTLESFKFDIQNFCAAYICGPEGFMDSCKNYLQEKSFNEDLIHIESFNSTTPHQTSDNTIPKDESDKIFIGESSHSSPCVEFSAIINGEQKTVKTDGNDSVLESLIKAGVNAPYSCMDGACMACLGKVTKGTVYQNDMCILTEENIRDNETLTCQCFPCSENVEINYDEI